MFVKSSCGQFILRKISKVFANRCQILRLKCIKIRFLLGLCPDPAAVAYNAPLHEPLMRKNLLMSPTIMKQTVLRSYQWKATMVLTTNQLFFRLYLVHGNSSDEWDSACCVDGDITQLVMSNGGVYHVNLELLQDIVGNVGTVRWQSDSPLGKLLKSNKHSKLRLGVNYRSK